jgi:streptogramin lyase
MDMRNRIICIGALAVALLLGACSTHQSTVTTSPGAASHLAKPQVVQTGKSPIQWTQFKWGGASSTSQLDSIATGSDGNMYYTDYNDQDLIRMTMSGGTKVFPLTYNSGTHFYPTNMVKGADGRFYISTTTSGIIGTFNVKSDSFSVQTIPSGDYTYDGSGVVGPDGNVWFTEAGHIAKITTGNKVTEFAYPDGNTSNYYGGIAVGSDGDIWATEYNEPYIDDLDVSTDSITVYSLPCNLTSVASATDGNLYGDCGNTLVRISTSGTWTEVYNPFNNNGYPQGLIAGLNGNPWFTPNGNTMIVEYDIAANAMHAFYPPSTYGNNYALTSGPDGNYWAIGSNAMIDVYIINTLTVSPPGPLTFTAVGQSQVITITEANTSSWTVTSSSPGVATVTPVTGHANEYTIKAAGLGTTTVTVKDAIGNSYAIKVTVT